MPATPLAFGQSVVASGIALSKTGSANLWQSSWRESLPGLLFSPAPGLVWFSPVLVLGLVSAAAVWRDPRFRALIPLQLGTVLLILVAGKWFDWWGGLSWGYRSIVDVAPFLAPLTVPIIDRIVASRPLLVLCGVLLGGASTSALGPDPPTGLRHLPRQVVAAGSMPMTDGDILVLPPVTATLIARWWPPNCQRQSPSADGSPKNASQ